MSSMSSLPGLSAGAVGLGEWSGRVAGLSGAGGKAPATREKIEEAAAKFESLMMSMLLKTARESGDGSWLGGSEDKAGASMFEMAEEFFADCLAKGGGMGLARMVTDNLKAEAPAGPNAGSQPARR